MSTRDGTRASEGGRLLFEVIEASVGSGIDWLRLLVEALSALVIAAGVVAAVAGLVRHFGNKEDSSFIPIRLAFARHLTLALELQLAADILSTALSPTWESIGKLAAVAIIRTALNYFLNKEIQHERAETETADEGEPGAAKG